MLSMYVATVTHRCPPSSIDAAGAWNVPFDEEESPEQDADISLALHRRDELVSTILEQLSKKHNINLSTKAITIEPIVHAHQGHGRSANTRFTEGSVHNGQAGERSVHGGAKGEGSVRGARSFFLPPPSTAPSAPPAAV